MSIIDASDSVTNPAGWAPLRTVIGIALHHTVTTISPSATPQAELEHIRSIDSYHVSQGWYGFGYHYAVFPSGRIYRTGWGCRAHVASRNHELIGIAWVGNLSSRRPSQIEIAAASIAVRDAWERIGANVTVKGHKDWALPAYPTACPGKGIEVIEEVTMQDRLNALEQQLQRLERIVAGHGEITVTANADNATILANITGENVPIGRIVRLSGEKAVVYLDRMGNNLYLGLSKLQEQLSTNTVKKRTKVRELRITTWDDGTCSIDG